MLQKFQTICFDLSTEFDFKEGFFSILSFSSPNEISLLGLIFITIFFIIIELALTNYILQVNPFQSGIAKPFYYFLMPAYWKKSEPISEFNLPQEKEFEPVASNKKPAVIVKEVNKSYNSWFIFDKYQVLKNFNFAIYEKQITVLLGYVYSIMIVLVHLSNNLSNKFSSRHNGAGKTTLMNCMTGITSIDKGSITVKGIPVSPYTSDFKKALDYCPQENVFYDALSVYENIKISAILKGVSFKTIDVKILNLVKQFDLQAKLNQAAKDLSGGMKRRLCLAIAIIGHNEVLVVDVSCFIDLIFKITMINV